MIYFLNSAFLLSFFHCHLPPCGLFHLHPCIAVTPSDLLDAAQSGATYDKHPCCTRGETEAQRGKRCALCRKPWSQKLCGEALCKLAVLSLRRWLWGHPGLATHSRPPLTAPPRPAQWLQEERQLCPRPQIPTGQSGRARSSVGAFLVAASDPLSICLSNSDIPR